MSSTTPPGSGPAPGDAGGQQPPQDYVQQGYEPAQPKRRGLVIGVVAGVVAAVGLPLGAFAVYNALSGGGTQPHDALPSDVLAYARIDVDPSASQKLEALRFLDKFPAFEDATGIDDPRDDVREAMFDAVKETSGCDLDFNDDVDPWLGERLGVGVFPPTDGAQQPGVAVAIQVKDEDAAKKGIKDLIACGDKADEPAAKDAGWAYFNEYLIVAETQALADGYAKAAEKQPLADDTTFKADMDQLGEQGVASVWFDGQGLMDAFGDLAGMGALDPSMAADGAKMTEQLEKAVQQSYRSGAVAFRFDEDYAEVAAVVNGDGYQVLEDAGTAAVDLPDSTALAFAIADGDRHVDRQWDNLLEMVGNGQDPEALLEQVEAQTGLTLPDDLKTLLGQNFALGLDAEGLTDLMQSGDPKALRLGARVQTDADDFAALVETVQTLATKGGVPLELSQEEIDGGVVVASNSDYAKTLAEGGDLGGTDKFTRAVKDADKAQTVMYVDFDALDPVLEQSMGGAGGPALENLKPLEAFGVSGTIKDGSAETTLRLTVK